MTRMLSCPHCHATAIPSWQRYTRQSKLTCRACGQRSRLGVRTMSLTRALLLALVVLPVSVNLLTFVIVVLLTRASFLFWPFMATFLVVGVWFSGRGKLIPVPTAPTAGQRADAAAAVRHTFHVVLKGFLPLMLGMLIANKSITWWVPLVRAWLQG